MKRYLIIGAGMQGVAAGYYLVKNDDCRVFFMDLEIDKAKAAADRINELTETDAASYLTETRPISSNNEKANKLIASYDGVLSAATFKINMELTKLCVQNGTHMVDLGGNADVVTSQVDYASTQNMTSTIIPDSGLAPGLGNILAQYVIDESQTHRVEILCGGIPEIGQANLADPLQYKLVFSYEGLINEYFEYVRNLNKGQIVLEDGFSDLEDLELEFDGKTYELEAFYTSGGTSRAPFNLKGTFVEDYVYKTLRYRGHRDAFNEMFHTGRETEIRQLIDHPEWEDIILLKVTGSKNNSVLHEMVMKVTECPVTGFSSMAQATAYPAAETLLMATSGRLNHGIFTPDNVFSGNPDMVRELLDNINLPFYEQKLDLSGSVQDMFGP